MFDKKEKHYIVSTPGGHRTWVIGAVHGDSARLIKMHQIIKRNYQKGDVVIYLGNLMGYGYDVGGVLDEVFHFRKYLLQEKGANSEEIILLRGMQEHMWLKLLTLQFDPKLEDTYKWIIQHGMQGTLKAYGTNWQEGLIAARSGVIAFSKWTERLRISQSESAGHNSIINSLKNAAATQDGRLLFVSSSIDASLPLMAQDDVFWWGTARQPDFDRPYERFSLVVMGKSDPQNYGVHNYPYYLHVNSGGGISPTAPFCCALLDSDTPIQSFNL